jgi:glycerol-1-phosphatase
MSGRAGDRASRMPSGARAGGWSATIARPTAPLEFLSGPDPMPLSPLLHDYDHLLLDLDGCVWIGDRVVPGSQEALSALRTAGKAVSFITNDAMRSPEEYVRKLWSLGMQASLEEVVTVGGAIQYVLAGRRPAPLAFVIGSPAVFRHVADAGCRIVNGTHRATAAEVVVVAGHDEFGFGELKTATQAVMAGAEMIAANRDRTFPAADGLWPGTGAIVAALEYATERTARNVGKPDRLIFETALDRAAPGRALMIGDRLDADLAGAAAAGLDAAIVLSGVTTREQAEAASDPAPVAVADDLRALVLA